MALAIKEIHDEVKAQLQQMSDKYKRHADQKWRHLEFEEGDLVRKNLKKERLPKGKSTKLMLRKLGPCQILKKFGTNAYEIQLPPEIGIYPIFNIADLTPSKAPTVEIDIGKISDREYIQHLPFK